MSSNHLHWCPNDSCRKSRTPVENHRILAVKSSLLKHFLHVLAIKRVSTIHFLVWSCR